MTKSARRGVPPRDQRRTSRAEFLEASGRSGAFSVTETLIRWITDPSSPGSGKRMAEAMRLRTSGKESFTVLFFCFNFTSSSSSSLTSKSLPLPLALELSAIFNCRGERVCDSNLFFVIFFVKNGEKSCIKVGPTCDCKFSVKMDTS